jgi:hypothetical protein
VIFADVLPTLSVGLPFLLIVNTGVPVTKIQYAPDGPVKFETAYKMQPLMPEPEAEVRNVQAVDNAISQAKPLGTTRTPYSAGRQCRPARGALRN